MSGTIVICEKKNQADDLRKALGTRFGPVLNAQGHIVTLKTPDETREEWQKWSPGLLWPGRFYEKQPVASTKRLLDAIRSAARTADTVIIATDCDREGQLIGDEILAHIGFRGKVMRAMFTAQDPKSLQEAFARLEPNEKYHGLYMAGQAREQADQTVNLSLTRTASCVMRAPGSTGAIGIGRVKTPVLGMVCKRELEIINFKPQDMFEIDADARVSAGSITLSCTRLPASLQKEQAAQEGLEDEEEEEELGAEDEALAEKESMKGRILDRRIAEAVKAAAVGHKGPIRMKAERKRQGPPKLLHLGALQSVCSARFGWSGSKTLEVAQFLYDGPKLTTYPRGDGRYLPTNMIPDVGPILGSLMSLSNFSGHRKLLEKPQVRKGKSGHFLDSGEAHHAIIPNVNVASQFARLVAGLPEDARKCWDVIARHYMAAMAPDYEYRQTTVWMDVPFKGHNFDFRTTGRIPLVPGWKEILGGAGAKPAEGENELCPVKDGETAEVTDARIRTVTTRPPARFSEGALLKAMQECWRLEPDPKLRAMLKKTKGIGTPATSGSIVEGLFDQGQLVMKGKSVHPTQGGMDLYKALIETCPNVVDPSRTALWETMFARVEQGSMTAEQAIEKILAETKREIDRIVASAGRVQIAIGKKRKPTPPMINAAKSIAERKGIKLPSGALTDSVVCAAFLNEHMPKREPGQEGQAAPSAPSEKQLELAKSIASQTGVKIPEDALKTSKAMSAWIDSVTRPPSEKQLAFAKKLAEENQVPLPDAAGKDTKACSAFIDKMMGGKGGSGGSGGKGAKSGKPAAGGAKAGGRGGLSSTFANRKPGKPKPR